MERWRVMFKTAIAAIVLAALPLSAGTSYYIGSSTEAQFNVDLISGGLTAGTIVSNFASVTGLGTQTITSVGTTGLTFTNYNGANPGTMSLSGTNKLRQDFQSTGSRLDITPGSPVYSIALHLQLTSGINNSFWCVEAPGSGSCDYTLAINGSGPSFLGIIGTSPLTSVSLRAFNTGSALNVNDVQVGTMSVTATPEPSTMALLGSALIVLPVLARRKKLL